VVLDAKGFVQQANPAATQLLGEPLEGEAWKDVIGRAFAPRSDDGHDLSLADGRRVSISTCPLGDAPGQVLLFTDVTETRRLQEDLSQHQRLTAMGEMAAGLAHQIRTPLASGLLYASRLKMPALEETQRQVLADKVVTQLRHLETLITDMLLFSRSGYCGDEQFLAREMLTKLERVTRPLCDERQLQLDVIDQSKGEVIKGNANILLSALQNLTNNALQVMHPGGTLSLSLRPGVCDTMELSVADTGPGISDSVKDNLFKPFFTTRSNGTGLGLAVVRAVAQAHGGSVRVEKSASGGCDFVVQLPCAQESNT
jgi:two-component system sensor histidine kinase FlrB